MKKSDAILLRLFFAGLPVLLAYALFVGACVGDRAVSPGSVIEWLYNLGGLVFAAWMVVSLYLCGCLLISASFREHTLAKLAFLKERDEREAMLTGRAAKATMLTTMAVLILLFCLSCFQVSVASLPPEKAVAGKTREISLGVGFSLRAEKAKPQAGVDASGNDIVAYSGLPVSSSAIILALIVWQVAAYNYSMRRLLHR